MTLTDSDHAAPPRIHTSAGDPAAGSVVTPSIADTAFATDASRTTSGGSAITSDHPTLSADIALSSRGSRPCDGGSAELLDHLALPKPRAFAVCCAAGGVIDSSREHVGTSLRRTSASQIATSDVLTLDQVLSVYDDDAWGALRAEARVFAEIQGSRKRVYQLLNVKVDGSEWGGVKRAPSMGRDVHTGDGAVKEAVDTAEDISKKQLGVQWRYAAGGPKMPLRQLGTHTPGLSWYALARLLGEAGHPVVAFPHHWEPDPEGKKDKILVADPPHLRSLRQWYSRCGFGDPGRRWKKGMTQDEVFAMGQPKAKVAAYLACTTGFRSAHGKVNARGQQVSLWPYRSVWDDARANYLITHPEWKPYQAKRAADRVMIKAFLRSLYLYGWADVYARLGIEMPEAFPLPLPRAV